MLLKLVKHLKLRRIPLYTPPSSKFSDKKSKSVENTTNSEEKQKLEKKSKEEDSAAERLNKLLSSMKTNEDITLLKSADIPKAGGRKLRKQSEKQERYEKERLDKKSKNIIEAAKDVANLMGEDKRKTESELLSKLLNHNTVGYRSIEELDTKANEKLNDLSLKDLISGMKIDRSKDEKEPTRAEYVRKTMDDFEKKRPGFRKSLRREGLSDSFVKSGTVNLFGEEPLGIFNKNDELKESPDCLKTWKRLKERELKLAVTHPPKNYFEKMAVWTEQGKIWKFPIDNEQGLEEEKKIDFTEHVFLEQHLESWCPKKGPIRHFMELVCVGLSKNPYITAQEKKEHILWYKDYFEQKKDILKEILQQSDEKSEQKELKSS